MPDVVSIYLYGNKTTRLVVATRLALHSRFSIIWCVRLELSRDVSSIRPIGATWLWCHVAYDRTNSLRELLFDENKVSTLAFPLHALSQLR